MYDWLMNDVVLVRRNLIEPFEFKCTFDW